MRNSPFFKLIRKLLESSKPIQSQQGIVQSTRPGNVVNRPGLLPLDEDAQLTVLYDQNDSNKVGESDRINHSEIRKNRFSALIRLLSIK